jgi:hypothetical protein
VGRPRLHASLDTASLLVASYDALTRNSAVSELVAAPNGGVQVLGSGHGLLPIENGQFVNGVWTAGENKRVTVGGDGQSEGTLAFGDVGNDTDYAVATFASIDPATVVLGHALHAGQPPLPIRTSDVGLGERVHHLAATRGYRITGTVAWLPIAGAKITLLSEGNVDVPYERVFGVTCEELPFSVAAESGSTVFDASDRVTGFVVGAGRDPDEGQEVSYVLSNVPALKSVLGTEFSRFFTEVS